MTRIPDSEKVYPGNEVQAIERLREEINALVIADPTVTGEPTGFPNRTSSTLTINEATGVVTIAPASGTYSYYYQGTEVVKSGSDTSDSLVGLATGTRYIYFDAAGDLITSDDFFDLSVVVPVAVVYWHLGTTQATLYDERHGLAMDWATHKWIHLAIGARYISGLAGTFADATFSIDSGSWADEDILFSTAVAKTTCHQWYRDGAGGWKRTASAGTAYYPGSPSSLTYDDGDGTLGAVAANAYVAMWVFATSHQTVPFHVVIGQRTDTTLANARANNLFSSLDLGDLPSPEMVPLYRVILRNDAAPYEETYDLRRQVTLPGGNYTATLHNTLGGRSAADAHPASAIGVDASGFSGNLSATDTDVQTALETLDAMAAGGPTAPVNAGTILFGYGGAWTEGFPLVNSEGLILTNAQGLIMFGGT